MIFKKIFLSLLVISVVSMFFGGITAQELPESFRILSHAVHQQVATMGEGGDITQSWLNQTGVKNIEWQTISIAPLHERFFREATLRETNVDVFYLLNPYATPQMFNCLEPLDDYIKSDPIEGFPEDFSKGMIDAVTFNGKIYGIPVRHATSSLHYNEEIFKERGLEGPPNTIEEFFDYAKKVSHTRSDGFKVYGFVIDGMGSPANIVDLSRAWDGDFLTTDFEVVCNEPPMVKAITMLRELYLADAFPKTVLDSTEVDRWMHTGRAAMVFSSIGRTKFYNDPDQGSQFSGKIKPAPIPLSEEITDYEIAASKTEIWCMTIPKNSIHKDLSWSFIKHLSTEKAAIAMALNGNGPTRLSVYNDPAVKSKMPYADLEEKLLEVSRIPFPAYTKSAEGQDAIFEEVQAAILGVKTPQKAMDDLAERLKRLLEESGL
jgi:multiple sugar transport system substrate-binding protein